MRKNKDIEDKNDNPQIKKRFKVFGYDTDVSKIKNIQLGKSYISNFSDDIIKNMLK